MGKAGVIYMITNRVNNKIYVGQTTQDLMKRWSSSRFKGVSYNRVINKWYASIQVDGLSINLGNYETEIEASIAFNAKFKEVYHRKGA